MLVSTTPEDVAEIFEETRTLIRSHSLRLDEDVVPIGVCDRTPPEFLKLFRSTIPVETVTIFDADILGPLTEINDLMTSLSLSFNAGQQREIRKALHEKLAEAAQNPYAIVLGNKFTVSSGSPAIDFLNAAVNNIHIEKQCKWYVYITDGWSKKWHNL